MKAKSGPSKGHRDVVFLHGLGGSSADWQEVLAALGKSVRGLALDLPGSGAGPKPSSGYDPVSLARWLGAEMEDRGLTSAGLVGHSLGARVAGELASREPQRVEALVLVAPLGAVGYKFGDRLKWKAMSRRAIVQNAPESSMRNALSYGFSYDGKAKRSFVERALAARTGPEGGAVASALEKSVDGILEAPPLLERLEGSHMPLLIVSGAEDPLAPPAESERLTKTRPDARVVRLPGLGHYPMIEDPKGFAEILKRFFDS